MGRRFAVHACALALISSTVAAAPKGKAARTAFDQGVAAYKKSDFQGAAAAFETSAQLEADVETLFAWAQAERKLGDCDKASDLYTKLLGMKMPAANKNAVKVQLDECKKQLADDKAARDAKAAADAKVDEPIEPTSKPAPEPGSKPAPAVERPPVAASETSSPWYSDALGDVLTGGGVIAAGVGLGLYISGSNLNDDATHAASVADYNAKRDQAESRAKLGEVIGIVGIAGIVGGIIRYSTRSSDKATLATFGDSHTAGVAFTGRF